MKYKLTEAEAMADYLADVQRLPTYHDGKPRPEWAKLGRMAQESWRYTTNPDRKGAP